MKSRNFTLLAILGLILVLAAPLAAQNGRIMATVPFEFVTGTRTLPAGEYLVDTRVSQGAVRVWNENTHDAFTVLTQSANGPFTGSNPEVRLVFNRYGNQYFLSRIWDGTSGTGLEIPMSKAERALLAKSPARETLVILARR